MAEQRGGGGRVDGWVGPLVGANLVEVIMRSGQADYVEHIVELLKYLNGGFWCLMKCVLWRFVVTNQVD